MTPAAEAVGLTSRKLLDVLGDELVGLVPEGLEERGGEVALAEARDDYHDALVAVLRSAAHLCGEDPGLGLRLGWREGGES